MTLRCFLQILTLFCFCFLRAQKAGEWNYVGPGKTIEQVKGFVKALYVDPLNKNFVLAGSGSGGLFKTENAFDEVPSWVNISDSYEGPNFGVSDIVVVPNTNNRTLFISTSHQSGLPKAYGCGILKTVDGGTNWKQVGPSSSEKYILNIEGLVANPGNFNEMIAYSNHEVYFTGDAWQTYSKIDVPIDKNNRDISFCDAEFAPYEPGKFYLCTRYNNKAAAQLFQCSNRGKSINDITPADVKAYRIEVATVNKEKFKGKFYIAYGYQNCYLKFFNGKTFSANLNAEPVTNSFANAYWCFELSVNQNDTNIIYLSLTETSRSIDGGKTFVKLNHYNAHNTHADVRAMLLSKSVQGGKDDELFIGNDGGVSFIQSYEPPEWKNLNGQGLNANQFWSVSVLQNDSLLVAGGTQDNGGFIITADTVVNTMYGCGDAYETDVIDQESAIIQCNPPSMYYYNFKKGTIVYLNIPDKMFEARRPLISRDSTLYIAHHDIWSINKNKLKTGKTEFKKVTDILPVKLGEGQHNNAVRCMDIGEKNSAIVCYSNPNWQEENSGKVFFCADFFTSKPEFTDITGLLVHNGFEVCRWSEVWTVEIDHWNPFRFYFTSRDAFNQANYKLFQADYFPDTSKCVLKEITYNLPPLGVNKIKTDKYSGITYLAMDDGIYYAHLRDDTISWKKLNTGDKKLPSVPAMDIDFNYHTNSIFAATYGRGIWKTQLRTALRNKIVISTNKNVGNFKIDGVMSIKKGKTLVISGRVIITNGSVIQMNKNTRLKIKKSAEFRDENNRPIDFNQIVKKGKKALIIFE